MDRRGYLTAACAAGVGLAGCSIPGIGQRGAVVEWVILLNRSDEPRTVSVALRDASDDRIAGWDVTLTAVSGDRSGRQITSTPDSRVASVRAAMGAQTATIELPDSSNPRAVEVFCSPAGDLTAELDRGTV